MVSNNNVIVITLFITVSIIIFFYYNYNNNEFNELNVKFDCPKCPQTIECTNQSVYIISNTLKELSEVFEGINNALLEYCPSHGCMKEFEAGQQVLWGIAKIPEQVNYYFNVASLPSIKIICEIGFNAGHSTALYLKAAPNATIYNFDYYTIKYSPGALAYIKNIFGNRFNDIKGNSHKTIKEFTLKIKQQNPNFVCDLISVDGDHSEKGALEDMIDMKSLSNEDTILLIDDICEKCKNPKANWLTGPTAAWKKLLQEGRVRQIDWIDRNIYHRGWVMGKYVFKNLDN